MNTTIIVIGIIVLGIILSLVYVPRISQPRRLDSLFKFVLTLLATLAGVFLAFQVSNYQESLNEKDFAVGLLSESAYEFEFEINYVNDYLQSHIENARNDEELEQFIEARPLHGIISLDILINSTLLSKFGSSRSTIIHSVNRELQEMRTSINSPVINPNEKPSLITSYIQQMTYMKKILSLEILYIKGDISGKEVEKEYDKLQQVR